MTQTYTATITIEVPRANPSKPGLPVSRVTKKVNSHLSGLFGLGSLNLRDKVGQPAVSRVNPVFFFLIFSVV